MAIPHFVRSLVCNRLQPQWKVNYIQQFEKTFNKVFLLSTSLENVKSRQIDRTRHVIGWLLTLIYFMSGVAAVTLTCINNDFLSYITGDFLHAMGVGGKVISLVMSICVILTSFYR